MTSEKSLPSIASLSGPTTLPPIVENKPTNVSLYLPSIFNDIERRTSLPASFNSKRKLPVYPLPPFHSSMHTVYRRDSSASASDSDGEPSAVFSRNSFSSDTSNNHTSPHYRITTTTTTTNTSTDPTPSISPSSPIHIHTGDSTLLLSSRRGAPRSGLRHSCKYPNCGWSFKRFEHLKRHLMTHSGEKPFVCEFPGCGKSFGRSDNFAAHARIHTLNPPPENGESNGESNPVDSEPASAQDKKRPRLNSSDSLSVHTEKKQRPSKSPSPVASQSPSKSCSIKMLLNEDLASNNRPEDPTDDERNAAAMCLASLPFAAQRDIMGLTLATNNFPLSPTSSTTLTSPSSPVGSPTNDYTGPFTFLERNVPVQQRRSLPMDFYPSRNETGEPTSTLHNGNNHEAFKAPARPSLPTAPRSQRYASDPAEAFDPSKPHVCTHPSGCNRRFKRREHLRRHSRTHTDEKPFVCPTCLKSFSRSDNLNQHARTHGVRTGSVSSTTTNTTIPNSTTFPTSSVIQRSSSSPSAAASPPIGTFDATPTTS